MIDRRKPRVILYDDDATILQVLEKFFSMRGYEVFTFTEPNVCPIYEHNEEHCADLPPCADVIMTDYKMPRMTGVELLEAQKMKGCKIDMENKGLMSGYLDEESLKAANRLGCEIIRKPFTLAKLAPWLDTCESRIDFSRPVGIKRTEARRRANEKVTYHCDIYDKVLNGVVVNVSESGFCLQARHPIPENQSIEVSKGSGKCCRSADVKWTRELADDLFMAGLNCR